MPWDDCWASPDPALWALPRLPCSAPPRGEVVGSELVIRAKKHEGTRQERPRCAGYPERAWSREPGAGGWGLPALGDIGPNTGRDLQPLALQQGWAGMGRWLLSWVLRVGRKPPGARTPRLFLRKGSLQALGIPNFLGEDCSAFH